MLKGGVLGTVSECSRGRLVAGVDEVGRGPLAGSVVAAAVILDPGKPIAGLQDSKTLSARKRAELDRAIRSRALAFAIAEATVDEIDQINILHASLLAMQRAVVALQIVPHEAHIDGNRCPELAMPARAIVKGDQTVACISAASIIAKVYRDEQMLALHDRHPDYGFESHKGYPTRKHFSALEQFGVLPEHRKSFAPVSKILSSIDAKQVHTEKSNVD